MNDILHTETVRIGQREYTINVLPDCDVPSPLEDDDVFLTYKSNSRYVLGNTPIDGDLHARVGRRIAIYGNKGAALADALTVEEDDEPLEGPLIGLAVYTYMHSSTHMSTRSWLGRAHHAEWDSGQSGFIYITEKAALEWMGGKRMTKAKLSQVYKNLEGIVEEFGRWVNGETYAYDIVGPGGLVIDSCCGFIGMDNLLTEARSAVKACHTTYLRKWNKAIADARREVRERAFWAARDVVTT